MAPPIFPADLLGKRSTDDTNVLIIVFTVVGGVLVITAAVVLYVILIRRARSNHRHSRNLSNTTAPLLKSKSQRRPKFSTPPIDHLPPPSDDTHPKIFTHSPSTTKPSHYEKVDRSSVASPLLSSHLPHTKPTLTSLSIPLSPSSRVTTMIPPSPTSSDSLYSQPSASTLHVVTTPRERKSSSPTLLPPMIPQYAYIQPATGNISSVADMRTITKLLKEREKRSERKSLRNVSNIECAESVEPPSDSDTSDDDPEPVYRPRSFQTNRNSVAAQDTSEECSNLALAAR